MYLIFSAFMPPRSPNSNAAFNRLYALLYASARLHAASSLLIKSQSYIMASLFTQQDSARRDSIPRPHDRRWTTASWFNRQAAFCQEGPRSAYPGDESPSRRSVSPGGFEGALESIGYNCVSADFVTDKGRVFQVFEEHVPVAARHKSWGSGNLRRFEHATDSVVL